MKNASLDDSKDGEPSSRESAFDVVQIPPQITSKYTNRTPIEYLPLDPFDHGADGEEERSSTEHTTTVSHVDEIVPGLPDDLDLGSDALETNLKVDPELLLATAAATAAQDEQERQPTTATTVTGPNPWGEAPAAASIGTTTGGLHADGGTTGYYDHGAHQAYDSTALYGNNGTTDEGLPGYYDENGNEVIYYEEEEGYDHQQQYHVGGSHAGTAYSSGGEYGAYGSAGTSPGMNTQLAWHVPSGGSGSDGGWGFPGQSGGQDPSRFYASSAMQSLCWEYYNHGVCSQGVVECGLAHGGWCETCSHYALHPTDIAAREAHVSECRARHDRLEAIRRSAHVECGICIEKVTEKPPPADRRFGLLNCEHPFCLSCIRSWRQQYTGGADVEQALRTCPICREPTHFITPSTVWPATPEEKESIVGGYKAKLGEIDCRHFNYGDGTCPFGTSCMYRHAYKDGRLEEAAARRVAADEGEIHLVQPVRLSDFIVIQRGRVRGRRR